MDPLRLSTLSRSLIRIPSRRDVLRVLAAAGFGLGVARFPAVAVAKRTRPKKARPNAFGCLNVGDPCRRARQCCSGSCQGKKGRKRCKAHDTGGCAAGADLEVCGGTNVACTTSLGKPGLCATTTGNAGYCLAIGDCAPCKTDRDCQIVAGGQLGPRAACVQCAECTGTGGTLCVGPDSIAM